MAEVTDDTTKGSKEPSISKPKKSGSSSSVFRIIHGISKTIAIVVGLALTVLSLMSLIGFFTDNFWIRLIPALVLALGAPLFLVDRLLPDGDQAAARGLTTDVLAVVWLGFGVLYVGLAQPLTGSLVIAEGDRYAASGSTTFARMTYWMGGASPIASTTPPDRSGDVDGGPTQGDAGATTGDGGDVIEGDATPSKSSGDGSTGANTDTGAGDAGPAKTDAGKQGKTYTASDLFKKLSPAVVTISARGSRGSEEASGTGFFIDYEGTIATNQHVIRGAKAAGVKLIGDEYPGGHRWLHDVELLVEDEDVDLALLRVPPQSEIEPLELGDSDQATPGERVICIGNPLGLEHTLSSGIVSARRVYRGKRWVQMTAQISPGNSGGPVITDNGLVIGIATATVGGMFGSGQNLNLAVPVNKLKALIRDDYPDRRQFESGPNGPSSW